jgi:hypothetical protein
VGEVQLKVMNLHMCKIRGKKFIHRLTDTGIRGARAISADLCVWNGCLSTYCVWMVLMRLR